MDFSCVQRELKLEEVAPVIAGQSGNPAQHSHEDEILNGVIDLDVVREMLTHFPYRDHQEAQELILSALQEINEHFGWVSLPAADVVAEHFGTSASRIYGLLTFYAYFRTQPRVRHFILLCHGMACYVMGSQRLVQDLEDTYGIGDGGTTADGELTVQVVNGCLGACDIAPLCKLDADFHGELTVEKLNAVIREAIAGDGTWRDAHPHPAANGSSHG